VPFANLNGYRLHYYDHDFADPWTPHDAVLMHHGLGRSGATWFAWVPHLSRHFRVLRVDARGHGESPDPGPDNPWGLDQFVEDVRTLLDELKLPRIHYVGDSLGGIIGIAFSAAHPDRVASLTLVATPTHVSPLSQKAMALGYEDMGEAAATMGSRQWWLELLKRTRQTHPDQPRRDQWLGDQTGKISPNVLKGLSKVLPGVNVSDRLPLIKAPTLILAPGASRGTSSLEQQTGMHQAIPNSTMKVFEGQGIYLHSEFPDRCAQATLEFLLRLQPSKQP